MPLKTIIRSGTAGELIYNAIDQLKPLFIQIQTRAHSNTANNEFSGYTVGDSVMILMTKISDINLKLVNHEKIVKKCLIHLSFETFFFDTPNFCWCMIFFIVHLPHLHEGRYL